MSILRPFRTFGPRGFTGAAFTLTDAEQLAPRVGRAVIVDQRTGARFVRRLGGWSPDGLDQVTLRRLRQRPPRSPEQVA